MDYPKLPTLKKKRKKDNQSLVVLTDGPLPSPSCFFFVLFRFLFFFFFLYAAGQLFYRRIHSSRVMVDTLGGDYELSTA